LRANRAGRLRSEHMISLSRGHWSAGMAVIAGLFFLMAGAHGGAEDRISTGRQIAHDFDKGNCLACHSAPRDEQAVTLANIAPPLIMMRERFPDREELRKRIWDPTVGNPDTIMPPYGKHRILTDREIDLVIDYLYTL
jgi:L-cysteine S-thiosulfotransferase